MNERVPSRGTGGRTVIPSVVVWALVAACTSTPPATPIPSPEATLSAPRTAPAPTLQPPPTPTPILGAWTKDTGIQAGYTFETAAYGDDGWLSLAACGEPACETRRHALLRSPDGATWTAQALPEDVGAGIVAWDGALWGTREAFLPTSDETHSLLEIWRGGETESPERMAAIDLGPCLEGCPGFGELFAAPRMLFVEWVDFIDRDRAGPYRSLDGRSWDQVDAASLGIEDGSWAGDIDAVTIGAELIVAAAPFEKAIGVWATGDGENWISLGAVDADAGASTVALATDGTRLVVAAAACNVGETRCRTLVSTSTSRGTWSPTSLEFEVTAPAVAYTGTAFVLAGLAPGEARTYTSTDGLSWFEGDAIPWGECGFRDVFGGGGQAFLVGDDDCADQVWRTPSS